MGSAIFRLNFEGGFARNLSRLFNYPLNYPRARSPRKCPAKPISQTSISYVPSPPVESRPIPHGTVDWDMCKLQALSLSSPRTTVILFSHSILPRHIALLGPDSHPRALQHDHGQFTLCTTLSRPFWICLSRSRERGLVCWRSYAWRTHSGRRLFAPDPYTEASVSFISFPPLLLLCRVIPRCVHPCACG